MKREKTSTDTVKRKRRSPEEVRERVVDAAGEEFESHGYTGATTAAIARRAEVTEAQIFRYFTSKADLYRTAIFEPLNRHFADFHARQRASADDAVSQREGARRYITELQEFIGQHSGMLMSLLVAKAYAQDPTEAGSGLDGLREYFDRGAAMMRHRSSGEHKVAPEMMVRVSFAAVLGCVLFNDWMFPPGLAEDGAIREATLDFVLDGLNANNDYLQT
ncbi:MAG: transcriptional regulator [Novosphingobium sp.]|nr:transcriptional regulator [Novosphingobium sp.]